MAYVRRGGLSGLAWFALILAVIGALNWLLVGLFEFNLVAAIFGPLSVVSRIIYVLVGVAGLYLLYAWSTLTSRSHTGGPVI